MTTTKDPTTVTLALRIEDANRLLESLSLVLDGISAVATVMATLRDALGVELTMPVPRTEPTPPEIEAFDAWLVSRRYSPRTRNVYVKYALRAADFVAPTPLAETTTEELQHWWSTLPDTADSQNQGRKALCAFFVSIDQEGGGPAAKLPKSPHPQRLPRPLSATAFEAFLAAAEEAGGRARVLGFLLGYTGCRNTEARRARWEQFDLSADPPRWWISGKGSARRGPKERCVPVHPRLADVLTGWKTPGEWVLPGRAGGPCSEFEMSTTVAELGEAAGLGHLTAHRLRHTAATLILERGNDLRAVQELLGHSSPATTAKYTAVIPGRIAGAVGLL